ncbi:hypothetical protein FQN50_004676 [Emmonsiellopsis sp. PD_5]|nr:hypothetical protein FQN50_004676 [Emmonsiellopsis sp. PD_5]
MLPNCVGLITESSDDMWDAPFSPEERYDDPGYKPTTQSIPIELYRQNIDDDDYWGFFIHAACWELLNAAAYPHEPDLNVLNDLLKSCPRWIFGFDWGHSYGGLHSMQPSSDRMGHVREVLGSVKDHIFKRNYPGPTIIRTSSEGGMYSQDPLDIPRIHRLIQQSKARSVNSMIPKRIPGPFVENDVFNRFPPEIRYLILCQLPSRDALNLILASSAFSSVQLPQVFWASRVFRDYDFVFETREYISGGDSIYNWKLMFDGIKASLERPAIQNRRRIWSLLRPLVDTMITLSGCPLRGDPEPTEFEPEIPSCEEDWVEASASLFPRKNILAIDCGSLYSRTALIDGRIVGVYVSFIGRDDERLVSGIRFVTDDKRNIELGYIIAKDEIYLDLDRASNGSPTIHGFVLAFSRRGVTGIAIALGPENFSHWAGSYEGWPQRRLVAQSTPIQRLRGDFDGSKLITLAIPSKISPAVSLRESCRWAPEIPPSSLDLHENSFHPRELCWHQRVLTLSFLDFGGRGGSKLSQVRSFFARVSDNGGILAIGVKYHGQVDGVSSLTVGNCGPYEEHFCNPGEREKLGKGVWRSFRINGPGGERIVKVEINVLVEVLRGLPFTKPVFTIHTNFGRKKSFPDTVQHSENCETIMSDESSVITGFYTSDCSPLNGLGVVTEPVATMN